MATITIRNLNEETKKKLRVLAARHGHSMEEEVRRILDRAVIEYEGGGMGSISHEVFEAIEGVDLEIPARSQPHPAPELAAELAQLTGQSADAAVKEAINLRLQQVKKSQDKETLQAELMAIAERCAAHIHRPIRAVDHGALLYDDAGMPG